MGLSAPIRASCPKPKILHESSPHTPINPTPALALSTFPLLFIQPCFFTLSTPVDLIMEMSIHAGPVKSRLVGIGVLFCHMLIPLGKQGVEFAHDLEFWCVSWGWAKGSRDRTGLGRTKYFNKTGGMLLLHAARTSNILLVLPDLNCFLVQVINNRT